MSTILRALKKLEQDKETIGAKGMPGLSAAAVSGSGGRSRRFMFSRRGLAATLICLAFVIVGGAAVYFFMQTKQPSLKPNQSAKEMATTTQPKSTLPRKGPKRAKSTAPKPEQELPSPKREPAAKKQVGGTEPAANEPAVNREPPGRPAMPDRRALRPDRETNRDLPEKSAPPKSVSQPQPQKAAKPSRATPKPAAKQPKQPSAADRSANKAAYDAADRLTGGRVKVQAIAWSTEAEERMAVINNRVVREGSTVEGFSVVAIRPDDVIVKEQGQLYRVIFGQP